MFTRNCKREENNIPVYSTSLPLSRRKNDLFPFSCQAAQQQRAIPPTSWRLSVLSNGTQSRDPLKTKGKWSHQEMPNPTPIVDQIWSIVRIHHHSFSLIDSTDQKGNALGSAGKNCSYGNYWQIKKIHSMLSCKETRKRPFLPQMVNQESKLLLLTPLPSRIKLATRRHYQYGENKTCSSGGNN